MTSGWIASPDWLENDPGSHKLHVATLEAPDITDEQTIRACPAEPARQRMSAIILRGDARELDVDHMHQCVHMQTGASPRRMSISAHLLPSLEMLHGPTARPRADQRQSEEHARPAEEQRQARGGCGRAACVVILSQPASSATSQDMPCQ